MYNQIIQLTNVTICNVVTCLRHNMYECNFLDNILLQELIVRKLL